MGPFPRRLPGGPAPHRAAAAGIRKSSPRQASCPIHPSATNPAAPPGRRLLGKFQRELCFISRSSEALTHQRVFRARYGAARPRPQSINPEGRGDGWVWTVAVGLTETSKAASLGPGVCLKSQSLINLKGK